MTDVSNEGWNNYRETMYKGWERSKFVAGAQDLEKELTELENNKLTVEFLEKQIIDVKYTRISEQLTHCLIIVKNGFSFTGESSCVDPNNYNKEIGEKIAYDNAFDKLWPVYGFVLKQHLAAKNKL